MDATTERRQLLVERTARRRQILKLAMAAVAAGLSASCAHCGAEESDDVMLEFDHLNGRDWIASKKSRWQRQVYYEAEFEDGQLVLACPDCNKKRGSPIPSTSPEDDEPF